MGVSFVNPDTTVVNELDGDDVQEVGVAVVLELDSDVEVVVDDVGGDDSGGQEGVAGLRFADSSLGVQVGNDDTFLSEITTFGDLRGNVQVEDLDLVSVGVDSDLEVVGSDEDSGVGQFDSQADVLVDGSSVSAQGQD